MKKRASINDVAKKAQVSKSTVSRFLSKKGYISKEAYEKIDQAIKDLEYIPSIIARMLRKNTTKTLGILVNRLDSSSETEILREIITEVEKQDIDVLIAESLFSTEKTQRELEVYKQKEINYLIIFSDTNQDYSWLRTWDIPIVFIGYPHEGFPSISFDNENAVYLLYEYLISKGYQKIGFLGIDDTDKTTGALRTQAYQQICQRYRTTPISYILDHKVINIKSYIKSFHIAPFFKKESVDSIICATDNLALGIIQYFQQQNLKAPIICGMGASPILKFLFPDYISIDFHYETVGQKSVELLFSDKKENLVEKCSLII